MVLHMMLTKTLNWYNVWIIISWQEFWIMFSGRVLHLSTCLKSFVKYFWRRQLICNTSMRIQFSGSKLLLEVPLRVGTLLWLLWEILYEYTYTINFGYRRLVFPRRTTRFMYLVMTLCCMLHLSMSMLPNHDSPIYGHRKVLQVILV